MGSKRNGAPAKLRRVVAFEIGAHAVTASEIELHGDQTRVVRRGSAAVAADTWDDLAGKRETLTQAIRSAAASAGIRSRQAAVVIPRRYVTVKYARLPQGSPEQIAGMVRFEAQQYVPFAIDDSVLDHQITSDPGDDMTTVMIVAARRSLVNDLLAAFDHAGIEVTHVSVSSLALAEHVRSEPMPVAILGVWPERVDMAVVVAGRLLFSREADISEVSQGSAAPQAGGDEGEASQSSPAPWAGGGKGEGGTALVTEIARSLAAYQNEHRTQPVERLVLVDHETEDPYLVERLSAALSIPVSVLDGSDAAALGLALHQSPDPISTINLLPVQRIERRAEARRKAVGRLTLVLVCALAAVGIWAIQQGMAAQARERRLAAFENRRLKALQTALKKTQEERDKLAATYRVVSVGLGRDRPVVDVLKSVSDALPRKGGIYLTQLTFDRNGPVVVHGSADDHEAVTSFLVALQASGVFEEARLGYLGDTKSVGGPGGAVSAGSAAAEEKTSFMMYCRLPHRADEDESTSSGSRRTGRQSASSSTADRLPGGASE